MNIYINMFFNERFRHKALLFKDSDLTTGVIVGRHVKIPSHNLHQRSAAVFDPRHIHGVKAGVAKVSIYIQKKKSL